jgi:two-component system, NtrC family, nitrogen regulation sensor histidine kinase NtrY
MIYNRYYLGIWIRVILLAGSIFLFWWAFLNTERLYTRFTLIVIIAVQIWEMVHYQNKVNRYLSKFLINLREQNFSFHLDSSSNTKSFLDLTLMLTEIQTMLFQANLEKEKQFHYLNYVVSHIDVGIITFYPSGKVELCNNAALKILGTTKISHLKDLNQVSIGLDNFVQSLSGGQQRLYKITSGNALSTLSFRCGEFRIETLFMKLVSFQDIQTELEEQELDSWQKLIRVLTHEIMNSITPVNTLAQTMIRQFRKEDRLIEAKELNQELLSELIQGLEMIEERGTGVLQFVEKFRSLTRLPHPDFQILKVDTIAQKLVRFFDQDSAETKPVIRYIPKEESLTILADEKLVFQSLINLIKNAQEALEGKPKGSITISAGKNENDRIFISVSDNGCGISLDDRDKIFIPFFTTKENGSGIGLSFTREVMRMHKGNITIDSTPGEGTSVYLLF